MNSRLAALALVALLAACSQSNTTVRPSPTPTNPIAFPLFEPSTVIVAREWHETVSASAAEGAFKEGAGIYTGHEVIAESSATIAQLEAWIHTLESKPPQGYTAAVTGNVSETRANLHAYGIDLTALEHEVNGKQHGIFVLAIDPVTLDAKAGPMLGMIQKYRGLPQFLRDPLDQQVKKSAGFTLSDALSPTTPIGAALGALDQLRASKQRGIVLIDATKR